MNTLEIEEAWAAAFSAVVAPVAALPGISVGELPNDSTIIIADCADASHRGSGYWTAVMRLQVNSPALTQDPLPTHSAAYSALGTWLEDPDAVSEAFEATAFTLRGFFVRTSIPRTEGMRHIGEITLVCGLQRTPAP